ncbi:DUF4864 domain-containing protein [Pseudooceanicola atlanticus]|uniref:DUF4864 domain-containing protein n=1 Tax=Pseudooceanicola atlanticus TaxID=1461694 RepID=A0A0A0EKC1_9RHOB|nr:DUF4864 domain-containing protein [Pseudooceanicola atlanticus]KGM49627.1 hypothetical protein ATO9_06310 [Pseudooceanicola atlanticus]
MRLILTVLALMTSLALTPLQAQQAGPDAPGDIVTRQFDAFRTDNLDEAFSYASPMIQFQFQDPQNFGMMVERGYPMVRDPGQVRMLDLREEGGRTVQRVEILDGKGTLYLLDYDMIRTEEGWKINGVRFVESPPLAT